MQCSIRCALLSLTLLLAALLALTLATARSECAIVADTTCELGPAHKVQCVYELGLAGVVLLDASFRGIMLPNGTLHGAGVYRAGDVVYDGNFENSTRHGQGRLFFLSGLTLEGRWSRGALDGSATAMLPDLASYTGGFRAGALAGNGSLKTHGGAVYKGAFTNSLPSGEHGRLTASDGSVYTMSADWSQGSWGARLAGVGSALSLVANCSLQLLVPQCTAYFGPSTCDSPQCLAVQAAAVELTTVALQLDVATARARHALAHRWPRPTTQRSARDSEL